MNQQQKMEVEEMPPHRLPSLKRTVEEEEKRLHQQRNAPVEVEYGNVYGQTQVPIRPGFAKRIC